MAELIKALAAATTEEEWLKLLEQLARHPDYTPDSG